MRVSARLGELARDVAAQEDAHPFFFLLRREIARYKVIALVAL